MACKYIPLLLSIGPTDYLPSTPPSTTILSPVIKSLAELAKKTVTPRKSSGFPHLPTEVRALTFSVNWSSIHRSLDI